MKKSLAVVLVLAAAGAVCLIWTQNAGTPGTPASVSGSGSSSYTAASSKAVSSETSSVWESGAASSEKEDEAVKKIKSQINLDWKKYTVREGSQPVKLQGKTYRAFEIWNDDYQQGPRILLDPDDGKLYTASYLAKETDKPIPLSEDKSFDKTVKTVTGTVTEDGAMMSFFIKTPDGTVLAIPRYGIEMNFESGSAVGKKVRVYYTGEIKGDDMSRAFITKAELVK